MTPAAIIRAARADELALSVSPSGKLSYSGSPATVERWLPVLREHKPELLRLLAANERAESPAPDTRRTDELPDLAGDSQPLPDLPDPWERRIAALIAKLEAAPALRYAMDTDTSSSAEDVSIALALRGKGGCEVRIPKSRWDAFRVLDMIERYVNRETA